VHLSHPLHPPLTSFFCLHRLLPHLFRFLHYYPARYLDYCCHSHPQINVCYRL
jgi:hypothetical protein